MEDERLSLEDFELESISLGSGLEFKTDAVVRGYITEGGCESEGATCYGDPTCTYECTGGGGGGSQLSCLSNVCAGCTRGDPCTYQPYGNTCDQTCMALNTCQYTGVNPSCC